MIIWTHRGNPGLENTLDAFKQAWKDGIRHFETDIHATSDGVLVLAHDSNIRRLTGVDLEIQEITFKALLNESMCGIYKWCKLDELVHAFPAAQISIDIKSDPTLDAFFQWLKGRKIENFVVGSFSSKRIDVVRKRYPLLRTALTSREVLLILTRMHFLVDSHSSKKFAMIPVKSHGFRILTKRFIKVCKSKEIEIFVWTVNSLDEAISLKALGISGVVTDNYPVLLDRAELNPEN